MVGKNRRKRKSALISGILDFLNKLDVWKNSKIFLPVAPLLLPCSPWTASSCFSEKVQLRGKILISWNWSIFSTKEQKKREKNLERHCLVFRKKYKRLKNWDRGSWNWIVFSTKRINWSVERNLILFYENKTKLVKLIFMNQGLECIVLTKKNRILSAWTTQVLISSQPKVNGNKNVGHL